MNNNSIKSSASNIVNAATNYGESFFSNVGTNLEANFNSVGTALNSIIDGGFIGIDETQLNSILIPAIESYCAEIEGKIDAFNALAPASQAFKGNVEGAVVEFITECKRVLQNMVAAMRAQIRTANKSLEQWKSGDKSVAASTSANISEVRAMGNNINLD